jgi:hypothetical protein
MADVVQVKVRKLQLEQDCLELVTIMFGKRRLPQEQLLD